MDPPAELAEAIAGRSRTVGESVCAPERLVGPASPEQGVSELELEGEVDLGRGHERGRALEQAHGGAVVLAPGRALAARSETLPCRGGEHGIVGQPELGAVREGLLEVVAEELVELDELGPVLLQPGGEALVEIRAGRLRERLVRRVADQQVAEAEAVLARDLRSVRPDQLLAHERGEARGDLRLVGRECLDGAAVEDLALDRAALEHASLGRLELVESGGEQRLQRRRDDDLALGLVGHRDHLLDEERVAARGASDPLAQVARECPRG